LQSLLNSIRARVEYPQAAALELPVKQPKERTMSIPLGVAIARRRKTPGKSMLF
jgi:hypothetical protein